MYKGLVQNGMTFKEKDSPFSFTLIFVDGKFALLQIERHVIKKLTAPMVKLYGREHLFTVRQIRSIIDYRIDVSLRYVNDKTDRPVSPYNLTQRRCKKRRKYEPNVK